MKIKLNRHQELRFVVVGVAPTAMTCIYHSFNCDKKFIYRQNTLKFYCDIQKTIILLCTYIYDNALTFIQYSSSFP